MSLNVYSFTIKWKWLNIFRGVWHLLQVFKSPLFILHACDYRNREEWWVLFRGFAKQRKYKHGCVIVQGGTNRFLLFVRLYLDVIHTHPDFPSQAITVSQVSYRKLTCTVDHDHLCCLFTLQQHVSASCRCLLTSPSSCTPADPRGYQRVSWSPIATSSLV